MASYKPDPAVYTVPVPADSVYALTEDESMDVPMPFVSLYTSMPEDAKCAFSVSRNNPEKRVMTHILPRRKLEKWSEERIAQKVQSICRSYPQEVIHVKPPSQWADLYNFFDAADLWHSGAWNLWLVIYRLVEKTEIERSAVSEWVYKWLTAKTNRDKLSYWDSTSDVLDIMAAYDWIDGGLLGVSAETRALVRSELVHWYKTTYSPLFTKVTRKGGAEQTKNVRAWIGRCPFYPHMHPYTIHTHPANWISFSFLPDVLVLSTG